MNPVAHTRWPNKKIQAQIRITRDEAIPVDQGLNQR